ncbi:MAG: PstS family phosphate ABC transporter substrate-binding protein [Verrucomicrobiota bacterium]|jgi:phosphate transport system substrate-binding protein
MMRGHTISSVFSFSGIALAGAIALSGLGLAGAHAVEIDPDLAPYTATAGVSGNIKSVGSDTMNNLMTLWAEGFRKMYPGVRVEIEGKGSSTAPAALIAGQSTFGPMSREMKSAEIDAFQQRYGYKPVAMRTAIDMLAVYVHKDNPIAQKGLTLQQIDAIFSKTRKGGLARPITTWGQLGLTGEWANQPIRLYGRNSASGTYGFFKENALFKGDFRDDVKEQPGSSAVVQGVATDRYAIGYSGIGYKTADVATVPIAGDGASDMVVPSAENAGSYPLSRFLYLYLNYKPGQSLDPLRAEFLKFVFSAQGQTEVLKDGYLPVPAVVATADLEAVGQK